MSFTVAEAIAVQRLVDWSIGRKALAGGEPVTEQSVKQAAVFLADRSYKKLAAGTNGNDVEREWGKDRP